MTQVTSDAFEKKLADLKAKLPAPLQDFVTQYGPVVLVWTAKDFQAWLELLVKGDVYTAYTQVLKGMGDQASVDEWGKINAAWTVANADNAARMNLAKEALVGLLKIVLAIALAAFGL